MARTFLISEKESKITVRTRTTGLLARFAHDLELAWTDVKGTATEDGGAWTAEVIVPIASLRVVGARKGDKLDTSALSADDRASIEQKIRADVLVGGGDVSVRAKGSSADRGEATLAIGSARAASFGLTQAVTEGEGGSVTASGRCELSLRALGIPEVKGPLNVFRVHDAIEVLYNLTVKPS